MAIYAGSGYLECRKSNFIAQAMVLPIVAIDPRGHSRQRSYGAKARHDVAFGKVGKHPALVSPHGTGSLRQIASPHNSIDGFAVFARIPL